LSLTHRLSINPETFQEAAPKAAAPEEPEADAVAAAPAATAVAVAPPARVSSLRDTLISVRLLCLL